ncbi:hypothetical protein PV327_002964 [Microctonus hyperodae]|uniref:Uncharacterized protein n=1 Tax=Microctonus hyperodae TaxID=165561 RepID=A0AA39G3B5_MICHY|nr:hypothetical protein PV327_002964 [Microctonus hyperodae]
MKVQVLILPDMQAQRIVRGGLHEHVEAGVRHGSIVPSEILDQLWLSAAEVLATVFWDCKGVLLVYLLQECQIVNALHYCDVFD